VLEGLCAAKAAAVVTRAQARELKALGKQMTQAVSKGDVVSYNATSQGVHLRVREIAGQRTVAAILERLRYQSVRYQFHVSLLPGRMQQGVTEHLAIIDAVTSGDPELAERAMREHLASVIGAQQQLAELSAAPIPVTAGWQ
jgi:DNA-binding GntR family transcriptional regulator